MTKYRKRRMVKFFILTKRLERSPVETVGLETRFGLVMHYATDEFGFVHQALGVSISDPITGTGIVKGIDVMDALKELQILARNERKKGSMKFSESLSKRIELHRSALKAWENCGGSDE